MHKDQESQIVELLRAAAGNKSTCSFQTIFTFFPEKINVQEVFQTLDNAARSIAPPEVANYSSLLAKKGTGCPGDGFFDTFKIKRLSEYESIAGAGTYTLDLTQDQKEKITAAERARVYTHAASNHV